MPLDRFYQKPTEAGGLNPLTRHTHEAVVRHILRTGPITTQVAERNSLLLQATDLSSEKQRAFERKFGSSDIDKGTQRKINIRAALVSMEAAGLLQRRKPKWFGWENPDKIPFTINPTYEAELRRKLKVT